ncbi:MAG TPA: hypothetical protein VN633_08495 [Bryobacteraceae bacterium]|nr:hypothetical protein [Bryobacteraceae bacterium]
MSLVVVTHNVIGAREFADRFAVLDKEEIAACRSVDDLRKSDNSLVRELAAGSET